ncbi:jg20192 [Pararge aegeria aegeria]|uniref:Jg20192 protein n=1 Tax=Pararge aegeria aegeria TaxID=348720 RepID=A0A8S4S489_9NEOP|nr:jg20192 [Pararge aegeria aegeria]
MKTLVQRNPTSRGRARRSFWTKSFQFGINCLCRNVLRSINQTTLESKSLFTRQNELPNSGYECKHVAKDTPFSRRSRGKCAVPAAAAAVPRGMRRRVIYDPPAAPPPRTPLTRARQRLVEPANQRGEQR